SRVGPGDLADRGAGLVARHANYRHIDESARMPRRQRERDAGLAPRDLQQLVEPRAAIGRDVVAEEPQPAGEEGERGVAGEAGGSHHATVASPLDARQMSALRPAVKVGESARGGRVTWVRLSPQSMPWERVA